MLLDIDSSLRGGRSKLKSREKGENRAPFSRQTSSPFRVTSEASPRGTILLSLAARTNFYGQLSGRLGALLRSWFSWKILRSAKYL